MRASATRNSLPRQSEQLLKARSARTTQNNLPHMDLPRRSEQPPLTLGQNNLLSRPTQRVRTIVPNAKTTLRTASHDGHASSNARTMPRQPSKTFRTVSSDAQTGRTASHNAQNNPFITASSALQPEQSPPQTTIAHKTVRTTPLTPRRCRTTP